ncbi:pseudouridine synthase [Mogibacterium pumilum]|uniref:pseudouridine synthase n=1 Tax=Mogibacterium pumilum TaxID=86332 RepID=UPI000B928F3C|nr:pseudouridine synthase [Mogibacterium pumilum]
MRINKYIASCGVTSRRKADDLIQAGKVAVNGAIMREPGYDVQPGDEVLCEGRKISLEVGKTYILLNKPVGYVTTTSDDKNRPTVLDLIQDEDRRIFPVGRLDYNTSGLLILTNDGDVANKLMHPSKELDKTYRAVISGILTRGKIARLEKGVDIGGFRTSPAKVEVLKHNRNSTVVDITIHEGKNHQVRRMFKAIDAPVQTLERIKIGELVIGRLAVGGYRKLGPGEVEYLKSI